jgi:hypothetical protein
LIENKFIISVFAMAARSCTESTVEQAVLAEVESFGWSIQHSAGSASCTLPTGYSDYGQIMLE